MKSLFLLLLTTFLPSNTFQIQLWPHKKLTTTTTAKPPFALPVVMPTQPKPLTMFSPTNHVKYLQPSAIQSNLIPTPAPIIRANDANYVNRITFGNTGGIFADSSNNYAMGSGAYGGGSGYGGQDPYGGYYGGISGYGGYSNDGMEQYYEGLSAYAPRLSTTIMALGFLAFGAQIASLIMMAITNNNNNNGNGETGGNEGTLDERRKRDVLFIDDVISSLRNETYVCELKSKCDDMLKYQKRRINETSAQQFLFNLAVKVCELPFPACSNDEMKQT